MVFVQERTSRGITYLYLDKSIRSGKKVFKISKYLGRKKDLTQETIQSEIKKFALEVHPRLLTALTKGLKKYHLAYPLTLEELTKIEEMNLKYQEIKKSINKKDWDDIKRRFVANFVFESNALEGNSLTLKNFSEIVFEKKITSAANLRDVYDAQNSYAVFSKLFSARKEITEKFILTLHQDIMNNIDDRVGYKKLPNIILGRRVTLASPKDVSPEIKKLLVWYVTHKGIYHPLELAFRFHHHFERIHPFADGNGRVGRMLLNYILIKNKYYPVIIRKTHRNQYLKALEAADNKKYTPLLRFALEKTKETYRKFFEIYYIHL